MSNPQQAVARVDPQTAMQRAADFLPVFDIETALVRRNMMVEFTKKIMVEGSDYGTIPGTPRPTLYKAGAEKLITFFGLAAEFVVESSIEDWSGSTYGEPLFYYRYKCRLTKNGRLIGEGEGSASSWESKYRSRWMSADQVPSNLDKSKLLKRDGSITEPAFAIDKGETGGKWGKPAEYWETFREAIRNKTAVQGERPQKTGGRPMITWTIPSTQYRVPNPDVFDQINTFQKMGQKRALVGAVLVGVNASEYFTQDLDDMMQTVDASRPPADVIDAEYTDAPPQSQSQPQQQQQSPAPAAAPKPAAPKPAPPEAPKTASRWPTEVQNMRARMTGKYECLAVFKELKDGFSQILGKDEGEMKYYDLLMQFGHVNKSDQFKTTGPAKDCASEMMIVLFDIIRAQAAKVTKPIGPEPVNAPFEATDDDLPESLRGNGELFPHENVTYAD